MEPHRQYIDFGSCKSNRGISKLRTTKKSMRNENDSILSNNDYPDINISLESSKSPTIPAMRKNNSPFL
jgi:hypothetical protein